MPRDPFDSARSFEEHQQRLANGTLAFFTNRVASIEAFTSLVNTPVGAPLKVLAFSGVGGIGKTELLNKFAHELKNNSARFHGAKLPHARFDMVNSPLNADIHALNTLSAGLNLTGNVAFSRFSLLSAMLSASTGAEPPALVKVNPQLHNLYQLAKGGGALTPLGAVVSGALSVGEVVGRIAGNALSNRSETARDLVHKAGGTAEDAKLFDRLQANDATLLDELMDRFFWDLQEGLDKRPHRRDGFACRAVIFIDTYERLTLGHAQTGSARAAGYDAWVRRLAAHCLHRGVLLVIAGRDDLRWHESEPEQDWDKCLEQHLLGGLSWHDAQHFLKAWGIGSAPPTAPDDLQRAIMACVPEDEAEDGDKKEERGCNPLGLRLCAEIVRETRRHQGADPSPELFRHIPPDAVIATLTLRFLQSLDNPAREQWLKELSLTPRFDDAAALALAQTRIHAQGRADWEVLTRYSFMEDQQNGFWRLHTLMRDCLSRQVPEADARTVHQFFVDHWLQRGEAALAFYHQWSLDPKGTLLNWSQQQEAARKDIKRIGEARRMLNLWAEIALDDGDRHIGDELWARTHGTLAIALGETSQLGIGAALTAAIEHLQSALRVYTEADFPREWATTQNNLGNAYLYLPSGDRTANLRQAIECYQAALCVRTEAEFAQDWAATQNNLGIAYSDLPSGDRAANLRQAIECLQAALRVYTEAEFPQDWATTQNNLGAAYFDLPSGDRAANLQQAITCYQAALRVYTEAEFPQDWAMTQSNLGTAYSDLPTGDRAANLWQAIECYQAALRVYTEADFPQGWATTQNSLGAAYFDLPSGDRAANLQHAVEYYQSALRVRTEAEFPQQWATTQFNMGLTWFAVVREEQDLTALFAAYECFVNARRGFESVGLPEYAARAGEQAAKVEAVFAQIANAQEKMGADDAETGGVA